MKMGKICKTAFLSACLLMLGITSIGATEAQPATEENTQVTEARKEASEEKDTSELPEDIFASTEKESEQEEASEEVSEEASETQNVWTEDHTGYYGEDGTLCTGWQTIEGEVYYFDQDGTLCTGWQVIDEQTYYFEEDGVRASGVEKIEEDTYLFAKDGILCTGEGLVRQNGSYYLFKEDGSNRLQTSADITDGSYLFKKNGAALYVGFSGGCYYAPEKVYGEQVIRGKHYYFDSDGKMVTGFVTTASKTVYYGPDGAMRFGQQKIDGSWYYFAPRTGQMAVNRLVRISSENISYYGSDGKRGSGQIKVNGHWRYFYPTDGRMAVSEFVDLTNPSKRVYYNAQGWMLYGLQKVNGKLYYFSTSTGGMMTANTTVSGATYLISSTGVVTGYWTNASGTWSYYNGSGTQLFSSDILYSGWSSAQTMTSSTSWIILVDYTNCYTMIFQGAKGSWVPVYFWSCSPGADSTPTVKGTFTVQERGYSFGTSSYTCYYYTQFYGNYLFHSVLYYAGTFNIKDGRLGQHLSHGCVRLNIDNAKWIYNNIPTGTKVYIY